MNRSIYLFGIFFLFAAGINIHADDSQAAPAPQAPRSVEMMPGLRRRAVILDIVARVLEQEQVVVWNETHSKLTIPGSPVGLRLVGSNVVVAVQFTPYIRRRGHNVLVAQGQIWIDVPNEGIRYHTSMQTIPLEFGEPIFFFPLGQSQQLDSSIEIMLTVKPYSETGAPAAEDAAPAAKAGND